MAAFLSALIACLGIAGAPAAAAAGPVSIPPVTYGASYLRAGTITWSNRSVHVEGLVRALSTSGCRKISLVPVDKNYDPLTPGTSSPVCNGVVHKEANVTVDVAGGPAYVIVVLADGAGSPLAWAKCSRTACVHRK